MMLQIIFYLFSTVLVTSSIMVTYARNPVHSVLYLILAFFNAAGLFILLNAELLAMLLVIVYVGAVAVLFLFVVMMMNVVPSQKETKNIWHSMIESARLFLKFIAYGFIFLLIAGLMSIYILPFIGQILITMHILPEGSYIQINQKGFWINDVIGLMFAWIVFHHGFKKPLWDLGSAFARSLPPGGVLGAVILAEISYVLAYGKPLMIHSSPALTPISSVTNTRAIGLVLYTDYVFLFETAGMILLTAMIGAIVLTHRKREGVRRQDVRTQMARRKEDTLEFHNPPVGKGIQ